MNGKIAKTTLANGDQIVYGLDRIEAIETANGRVELLYYDNQFLVEYQKDGVIRSNTGQLVWDISRPGKGFFTVNAPGTKAVVGFAPDKPIQLGKATIEVEDTLFAGVFLSSLSQDKGIDKADRILVTTMARAWPPIFRLAATWPWK